MRYPFVVPEPAPLTGNIDGLRAIEASKRFTNFGPLNREFEQLIVKQQFGGKGACCTVANATLGLMVAIRAVVGDSPAGYAIVPSFTFAATAHAAMWCGLRPLFCDIDNRTWLPDVTHIEHLLRKHGSGVAVVIPYATFGNNLDLADYDRLSRRYAVPVVVDAAASLGARVADGSHFGRGFRFPLVFSMHATKTFATAEGGIVYCGSLGRIETIRRMTNFGFDQRRVVRSAGLNAKLPEVIALMALSKLNVIEGLVERRSRLFGAYQKALKGVTFQQLTGTAHPHQFLPARLAGTTRRLRDRLVARLAVDGVEARTYFSPSLHRQRFFRSEARLPVTERLSDEVVSLPLHDSMSEDDVRYIARAFNDARNSI